MAENDAVALIDRDEAVRINKEMKKQNAISLLTFVAGIVLKVMPLFAGNPDMAAGADGGGPLGALGSILMIVGLVMYARMKGRSGWFGLLGLLSCIGLLILYFLQTQCKYCGTLNKHSLNVCKNCSGPVGLRWKESDLPEHVFD